VRSCLMHGSETWPTKVEHEMKLNRTEISMIRWMCGVKLNVRRKLKKDWNQSVWWTRRDGWDGFDMWNIKMIMIGSNVWHWKLKELHTEEWHGKFMQF